MSYKDKIFVQIASYRDPELVPTIQDMLNNATRPDNLVLSIAWQHSSEDEWDNLSEFENDSRFKIIDIDYNDTKGVCWARNLTQQLYSGEEYTLQIDSHMRFVKGWDDIAINQIKDLQNKGYKKPLLTCYAPSYDPENDPDARVNIPWRMNFDRFTPEGVVFFLPEGIPDSEDLNSPVPARFYSAHFCFTLGCFSKEVMHDPQYYFHGEEISIAARAFTHGYDLFHPHRIIAWHEYTRKNRNKHWDDCNNWQKRNTDCHLRNRKLFGIDSIENDIEFNEYGFGDVRTLRDYEKYAGLLFENRSVQQYTLDKEYPPNPVIESEEEWKNSFTSVFKHCIDVSFDSLPEDDYNLLVTAIKDESGREIHRKDLTTDEIVKLKNDPDGYGKIWVEFNTSVKPKTWLIWPRSSSKGWCDQIIGNINKHDK